ncbi:hypothetical protein BDV09DRAFT_77488 [Aspergillus tetrazonus]
MILVPWCFQVPRVWFMTRTSVGLRRAERRGRVRSCFITWLPPLSQALLFAWRGATAVPRNGVWTLGFTIWKIPCKLKQTIDYRRFGNLSTPCLNVQLLTC